jgi:hypothetical protein
MKKGYFKGKHAILVLLSILTVVFMAPVLAEEEYHVVATLEPSNPQGYGGFGGDIALSGDLLLIGEWWGEVEEFGTAGQAYLYDTDWNLLSTLQAPEPELNAEFGRSVDLLGDMMVIGSPVYDAEGLRRAGEAYVFDSDGSFQFTLQSPEPQNSGNFGIEVALGKDIILVAETGGTVQGIYNAGVVHVYNTKGVYITTLMSPSMKTVGLFGDKLAANDEFILIGEYGSMTRPDIIGSVHVFDYDWNLITTIQAPEQVEGTMFGISIAIRGETVVVGEVWADVEGHDRAGRAYVFDTDWNHLATLQSTAPKDEGEFGIGTAIGGDIMVVGERRGDVISINEGKAYVYDLEGNLLSTLASPNPTIGAHFSWRVATDGEIVIVSDVSATVDGITKAGKVHVFSPGPGAEPEAKTEPASVQEEANLATEEKKPSGGIPGFPYESIIIGLVTGAFVLWLIQRRG